MIVGRCPAMTMGDLQRSCDVMGAMRGRAGELHELERLIAGARGGSAAVVLVEGPAGIGKSTLLEATAETGAAQGMTVAAGRADELDQISPWSTLVQAFSSTEPSIFDRTALEATPGRLDQRAAVLDAFRDSLESAALSAPLLVLLDDLQWADQATVAALGWLPEQLFSYPVLWLLARRPLPRSSSLDALVTRLEGAGSLHWGLGPLDEADTLALATDVAGHPIEGRARELLRATGGNPLFIVEVVQGQRARLDGDGHLDTPLVDGAATGTEDTLQALVGAHVRSLSPPTTELLKVASVLGQEFTVAEASELSGRPSAQLLFGIEEAITGGVLLDAGEQLAFRHDVFRQVLYESIPESVRRTLHAEAAAVLRRNGASATRLAHQLMIGAEADDPEAVASLQAAMGELVGTSPWAAGDLALRLVELTPPEAPDRAATVAMAVQLLGWAVRTDEARALGESFLESASVDVVTEAELLAGIRRAWLSHYTRPYPRPLPPHVLEFPGLPAPLRASLLVYEGLEPMWRNDVDRADATLQEAAAVLQGTGDFLDAVAVRQIWVLAAQLRGHFSVALERARHDFEQVGATNEPAEVASSKCAVAMSLGALGRIEEGLRAAEQAIQAAETSGFPNFSISGRCTRAAFFLDLGRLDDAQAEATAACAAAFDVGYLSGSTLASTTLVESSLRRGDLVAAEAALQRQVREGEGESIIADEYWAVALLAEARGRGAAAMEALSPVFGRLAQGNFVIVGRHPARLPQLVALALREGDEDAAAVVAAAAAHLARANEGVSLLEQVALHTQGLFHRDAGLLRDAYERSKSSEALLLRAILAEDLGLAEAEAGRRDAAAEALTQAFESFADMGAEFDVARVRAKLRKVGIRKRHAAAGRPNRGWASLTPAELSVVRVIAKGSTNRAAAEELSLSPDTVNTHLRHVFTKLDIRSRTELARVATTHDV
jgi:DNA-binding CsgD family transcriptional regulator